MRATYQLFAQKTPESQITKVENVFVQIQYNEGEEEDYNVRFTTIVANKNVTRTYVNKDSNLIVLTQSKYGLVKCKLEMPAVHFTENLTLVNRTLEKGQKPFDQDSVLIACHVNLSARYEKEIENQDLSNIRKSQDHNELLSYSEREPLAKILIETIMQTKTVAKKIVETAQRRLTTTKRATRATTEVKAKAMAEVKEMAETLTEELNKTFTALNISLEAFNKLEVKIQEKIQASTEAARQAKKLIEAETLADAETLAEGLVFILAKAEAKVMLDIFKEATSIESRLVLIFIDRESMSAKIKSKLTVEESEAILRTYLTKQRILTDEESRKIPTTLKQFTNINFNNAFLLPEEKFIFILAKLQSKLKSKKDLANLGFEVLESKDLEENKEEDTACAASDSAPVSKDLANLGFEVFESKDLEENKEEDTACAAADKVFKNLVNLRFKVLESEDLEEKKAEDTAYTAVDTASVSKDLKAKGFEVLESKDLEEKKAEDTAYTAVDSASVSTDLEENKKESTICEEIISTSLSQTLVDSRADSIASCK